ncbi:MULTISPECIES: DUF4136 domain-containing protein [unclassified Microbulbifer]|uniref:DUF4136 domain-containing protein n=1 Tax=unclassified Microbulbifer TaxID=2619833 RepID=UPI001E2E2F27|nr:DUF4136 domain-containing protein [Microbulbifer sp. YPW16]UHQ56923.1 DUF4136 domain-containing protein [Microbulbifer sp. YPW16]
MKVGLRASMVMLLLLVLGGCAAAPQVAVDYDPQADFAGMRTYYLLDPVATGPVTPLEIKRARQAVEGILQNRYRAVDNTDDADFLVQVQFQAVEKVAVYEDSFGLYGGYRYWGFGWRSPVEVRQYRQDTLVVDILSPESSPLWRGSMPSSAGRYQDPAQRQQRLREEAALLLNRFPPAY